VEIPVNMKADIGDHIEYYYLDTEVRFGCLIESGSGHAIDFVRPARIFPSPDAPSGPSPATGLACPLTQVSIVVRDLDARLRAWHEAFGWGPWRMYDSATTSGLLRDCRLRGRVVDPFRVRWAQARVDDTNVELIEPLGGASPWQQFLDVTGEGIASIGITLATTAEVDRLARYLDTLGIGQRASASVGGNAGWVLFDTAASFKCLIAAGTGHALDVLEGGVAYP